MKNSNLILRWSLVAGLAVMLLACDAEVKVDTDTADTSIVGDGDTGISNDGSQGEVIDGAGATNGSTPDHENTPGDSRRDSTDYAGDTAAAPGVSSRNIRVSSPQPGDVIAGNRFTLRGESRTFENTASYRLRAGDGSLLAEGFFTAVGEMGTFSPFTTPVEIARPYTGDAVLEVFQFSAKDGSEIDKVRFAVKVRATTPPKQRTISVFFTNSQKNPGAADCSRVFATSRVIASTSAVARAALEELLRGPSESERRLMYDSEIPPAVRLRDITIDNGVARADFSRELNTAAGSCRVTAIRAQIERTIRQFPSVQRVVISVEGNSAEALQP